MANVSIDLGFFSLIIVTTLFANGSSSSKDVYQRKEIQMAKLNVLSLWDGIKSGNICSTCDQSGARKRSKRCTCYSYRDKECVYYCHLDIIWVNTPDYGGSQRMRRSAPTERRRGGEGGGGTWTGSQRCVCLQQIDSECSSFCIPTGNRGHKQTSGELLFPVDIFSSPGTDT